MDCLNLMVSSCEVVVSVLVCRLYVCVPHVAITSCLYKDCCFIFKMLLKLEMCDFEMFFCSCNMVVTWCSYNMVTV